MLRPLFLAVALLAASPSLGHAREARASPAGDAQVLVVDLNTATLEQLDKLPGIGPSKARAILEYRARRGGFKSIHELRQIKGFGRKTLARLRPHLTVSPPGR